MRPEDFQDPGTADDPRGPAVTPEAPEDQAVDRLLRSVAPPSIPDVARQRVRRAAHHEWQQVVTARRRRRRSAVGGGLLAASLAALLLAPEGWLPWQREASVVTPIATIEAVVGSVGLAQDQTAAEALLGAELVAPHSVETGDQSRIAFRLASGHALRVDVDTRLEILDAEVIALHQGAVYVDSAPAGVELDRETAIGPIEIRTPWGVARDIGTQFEVRVGPEDLRVRVREGRVEIGREGPASAQTEARAGTELTLSNNGDIRRRAIEGHGPEWGWNLEIAPTFVLEGATLDDFLDWLVRETGWSLELADPVIAQQARSTVLHGDLEGIPIERTPDFVLATCGLRHELRGATLWIDHLP